MVRGSTIAGRSFSLHDREHLFELNEVVLRLKPHWLANAGELVDQGEKIWVGKNVKIDSTANLLGPIAIGDDVEIGADAVVVGPSTIGRGSKIGAGIVLKRSVVFPDTTLASSAFKDHSLSQAIVLGGDQPTIQAMTPQGEPGSMDFRSLSVDRPIRIETVLEGGATPALTGFSYRAFRVTKRGMDIVGAGIALALTLPFYPLIMLAIYLNSPGSIFYGALRQGRGGRNFTCWKFRTMVLDADDIKRKLLIQNEVDGPQFKIRDDPRIFFVGRWLRKLNIDEWPQFWNVLVGQMSIVGPRPSPEKENQMCPAWREARLSVRPGITGLWQVSRRRDRGETDFQEWIYYDVQYIKKQSIWLDLRIFFKTFLVVLGGGQ
jgi:lipopolysaccharide/colanic/teichoic acid biosynthesis glycosyltransferase